jgi:hypothetical protein
MALGSMHTESQNDIADGFVELHPTVLLNSVEEVNHFLFRL